MSTWLYLECTDHDPPVRADSESGQHLYDLQQIREAIAKRDEYVELYRRTEWDWPSERFLRNTVQFLNQHPKCHVRIRDEYGREHLIVDLPEGEDMSENILNKRSDEVAGDHPELPVDRVKMIVSEATVSSHTETERSAVIDRTVERSKQYSDLELRLHVLTLALGDKYEIKSENPEAGALELASDTCKVAEVYLAWLKS